MKDVLVIENDKYSSKIGDGLSQKGFVITKTTDLPSALDEIEMSRYAVIMADINTVSERDEFWERHNENALYVPVILTCDKDDLETALFPIKRNVYDIVLKPYNLEQISDVIGRARDFYLRQGHIKETLEHIIKAEVSFSLPSNKALVGSSSEYIKRFARDHGFEDSAFDIAIAFEEALINAIEHGNNGVLSKKVLVVIRATAQRLVIEIEDEGEGFDYGQIETGVEALGKKIYASGGRGLFLIGLHTDEFYYENEGRKAVLIKKIN